MLTNRRRAGRTNGRTAITTLEAAGADSPSESLRASLQASTRRVIDLCPLGNMERAAVIGDISCSDRLSSVLLFDLTSNCAFLFFYRFRRLFCGCCVPLDASALDCMALEW
ncbi:hypothetical protein J6590_063250 [Homalodisca vitripennis]|nr:hypothetical protein J6590_063250 [Homalodisca vitripennis]